MEFEKIKNKDGYYEQLASLKSGMEPIFKIRAVLDSNGNYSPIVRDYVTGKLIISKNNEWRSYKLALKEARELAVAFLIDCAEEIK